MKRCVDNGPPKGEDLPGSWKQFQERQYRTLWILGSRVKFQIDSAADVSIVNEKLIAHLGVEAMMKQTDTIIRGIEGERVLVKGAIELKASYGEEVHVLKLIVVEKGAELLSGKDAELMGMVRFDAPKLSKYEENGINNINLLLKEKEDPLKIKPNQQKPLEKSSSPQMPTEEVLTTNKIMKIYVPDESNEEVPQTKKSEKTSPPKRTKEEVPQPMAAEVVWSSENFALEMPTRVKSTRITNEEYHITLREGARPFISENDQ